MNILLFDVDGVLIEDRGYRAGVMATINHFSRLMGQHARAPDDITINLLHAHGYTNEWDICPFAVGMLIVSALRERPDLELAPAPFGGILIQFRTMQLTALNYEAWITRTHGRTGRPSERALAVLGEALADLSLSDATRQTATDALKELLSDPYDFANATVTQVFQEYVLGSSLFEEVYRRRPRFDVPSLLYDEDRAAIQPAARSTLLKLQKERGACICVYTARPSLPPSDLADWLLDAGHAPVGFSPEAELGLQLIDLPDLPLIAMGRMQWLAAKVGSKVEYLTKPAPVQALAAIFAAVTHSESDALLRAYRLVSEGDSTSMPVALWREPVEIWLVEDAVLGIHSAIGAVDLLHKRGVTARLHALGVATGGPKAEALGGLCEAIFPTVNEAIVYIDQCSMLNEQ